MRLLQNLPATTSSTSNKILLEEVETLLARKMRHLGGQHRTKHISARGYSCTRSAPSSWVAGPCCRPPTASHSRQLALGQCGAFLRQNRHKREQTSQSPGPLRSV